MLYQKKQVKHSSGAPIAIGKWMDGFKLVVLDSKPNQRINASIIMDILLPISQKVPKLLLSCRWRKYRLSRAIIGQCGSGRDANIHIHALDRTAYFDCGSR